MNCSCELLKEIFIAVQEVLTVDMAMRSFSEAVLLKIDRVAFGVSCEAPTEFAIVKEDYHRFRVRFGLEKRRSVA